MSHSCPLCDNPYPYMCSECYLEDVGPAASRQQAPTLSMGKQYLQDNSRLVEKLQAMRDKIAGLSTKKPAPAFMLAPKKNIGSGEDVCC